MIDQSNANSFVAGIDFHNRFFEVWRAEKPTDIIAESIGFGRHAQSILIELAISVLVVKQDNGVLPRIEIGEDHCTFHRGVGPQSHCGKPARIVEEAILVGQFDSASETFKTEISRL